MTAEDTGGAASPPWIKQNSLYTLTQKAARTLAGRRGAGSLVMDVIDICIDVSKYGNLNATNADGGADTGPGGQYDLLYSLWQYAPLALLGNGIDAMEATRRSELTDHHLTMTVKIRFFPVVQFICKFYDEESDSAISFSDDS